jgi:hypothetical protein
MLLTKKVIVNMYIIQFWGFSVVFPQNIIGWLVMKEYNERSIQVLKGTDGICLRPAIYIDYIRVV